MENQVFDYVLAFSEMDLRGREHHLQVGRRRQKSTFIHAEIREEGESFEADLRFENCFLYTSGIEAYPKQRMVCGFCVWGLPHPTRHSRLDPIRFALKRIGGQDELSASVRLVESLPVYVSAQCEELSQTPQESLPIPLALAQGGEPRAGLFGQAALSHAEQSRIGADLYKHLVTGLVQV